MRRKSDPKYNAPRSTKAWGIRTPGCFYVFPQTIRYTRAEAIAAAVAFFRDPWTKMKRFGYICARIIVSETQPRVPAPSEK